MYNLVEDIWKPHGKLFIQNFSFSIFIIHSLHGFLLLFSTKTYKVILNAYYFSFYSYINTYNSIFKSYPPYPQPILFITNILSLYIK